MKTMDSRKFSIANKPVERDRAIQVPFRSEYFWGQ